MERKESKCITVESFKIKELLNGNRYNHRSGIPFLSKTFSGDEFYIIVLHN